VLERLVVAAHRGQCVHARELGLRVTGSQGERALGGGERLGAVLGAVPQHAGGVLRLGKCRVAGRKLVQHARSAGFVVFRREDAEEDEIAARAVGIGGLQQLCELDRSLVLVVEAQQRRREVTPRHLAGRDELEPALRRQGGALELQVVIGLARRALGDRWIVADARGAGVLARGFGPRAALERALGVHRQRPGVAARATVGGCRRMGRRNSRHCQQDGHSLARCNVHHGTIAQRLCCRDRYRTIRRISAAGYSCPSSSSA
jgi:hypothetical protein